MYVDRLKRTISDRFEVELVLDVSSVTDSNAWRCRKDGFQIERDIFKIIKLQLINKILIFY